MSRVSWLAILAMAGVLSMAAARTAHAQARPYIGYVYPAGGQQGTTLRVKLGGQNLDTVDEAIVSGDGVSARVVDYCRRLGAQEAQLLREQLRELRQGPLGPPKPEASLEMIARIQRRQSEFVARPACAALSSLVIVEVSIKPDAKPGPRELTLATTRGVSNPLVFHVGQLPEVSRTPMRSAAFQVLGKEELALRTRPPEEVEDRVTVPCTMNGQIASGEVNRYRFPARKGQRLVISAQARQLVPYIADAVPGWFQPVMSLYDARGKEVAYSDDYRFQPDPVILYEVPEDGEYVLGITDAIYRGREDFVYRITLGEMPFVTSIFPLGGRAGQAAPIQMQGWNLDGAELTAPAADAPPGVHRVFATKGGLVSNRLPFELDTLPETLEKEPNNDPSQAQKVELPVIINGRIDAPDDWDAFQVAGHAGDVLVAEVSARRLDSPVDSILKITGPSGKLLAVNDDHEDPQAGANTHDADSYLMVTLPADGNYCVHVGDVARHGGEEYAYRLRLSAPQPDFAIYAVPSSISFRGKATGAVTIHAIRKDGFAGPIKLDLKDPPAGFVAPARTMPPTQAVTPFPVRTTLPNTNEPVNLAIEGSAKIGQQELVHQAIPAEDRMQAFLWRHLVPAQDLKVLIFDQGYQPPPKRVAPTPPPSTTETKPPVDPAQGAPKFTKQQAAGRLRQLKLLFEEGLLTDDFYLRKVAQCEVAQ
ncbi:MAG: hypothetical protein ACYC35_15445 [Pirellulales bacterium]